MLSSIPLVDQDILLRPFRFNDSPGLYHAVQESLKELKPWMSWATDGYTEMSAREYITIARMRWDEHTFYAFAITSQEEILGAGDSVRLPGVVRIRDRVGIMDFFDPMFFLDPETIPVADLRPGGGCNAAWVSLSWHRPPEYAREPVPGIVGGRGKTNSNTLPRK